MYPNLFKVLGHKPEDLSKYDVPLVGFDGKTIVPRGMIFYSFRRERRCWMRILVWWRLVHPI